MPNGSAFHTVAAATLKPREANVVRTRGTDNKLVFAENGWECGNSESSEDKQAESNSESYGSA